MDTTKMFLFMGLLNAKRIRDEKWILTPCSIRKG
jgi:hypothetical protein